MLSSAPSARQLRIGAVVYAPSFYRDEEALMRALKNQQRGAQAVFFGLYAESVEELLQRVLGLDPNLPELVSEVFRRAFASVHSYHGAPQGLRLWVLRLAVQQATRTVRWRRLRGWMSGAWLWAWPRRAVCQLERRPIALGGGPAEVHGRRPAAANVVELRPGVRRHARPAEPRTDTRTDTRIEQGGGVSEGPRARSHSSEQLHDELYALLDRLPVRVRVPVALRFLAQLEIAEIAVLCDLGLSQVRHYVNEGCSRLMQLDMHLLCGGGLAEDAGPR